MIFGVIPFNKGQRWPREPIGPLPVNWPTANSMYNIGTPHTIIMMAYGIRKTPKKAIRYI